MSEAEVRRNEKPPELATKKKQAVLKEETEGTETATAAKSLRLTAVRDAVRDALNSVQQDLKTRKNEQKVRLELENERTQDQLKAF